MRPGARDDRHPALGFEVGDLINGREAVKVLRRHGLGNPGLAATGDRRGAMDAAAGRHKLAEGGLDAEIIGLRQVPDHRDTPAISFP